MKQVTMESVKQRIADLESAGIVVGGLSLSSEFELACLRELVAVTENVRAVTEQRDAVVVENAGLKSALTAILQPGEATLSREHRATAVAAIEAPATDSAITSLRAKGVEMLRDSLPELERCLEDTIDLRHYCSDFARQLRESKGEVSNG